MGEKRAAQTEVAGSASVDYAVYELLIFALAILSVVVVVMYYLLPVSDATREALLRIDFLLCVVFLYDSCRSLFRASDKRAYLKWGWLDFLGSIPLVIPLRVARVARLVRAWRVVRARSPKKVLEEFERDRPMGVLLVMVFLAMVTMTISSLAVLELEGRVPDSNIASGGDAFWWAFVTVTTVGYGDHHPVTPWGRAVAIVLMIVGVTLFGVLTSFLASRFVAVSRPEQGEELAALRDEVSLARDDMERIRAELAAITDLLQERDSPSRAQTGRDSEPHEGE